MYEKRLPWKWRKRHWEMKHDFLESQAWLWRYKWDSQRGVQLENHKHQRFPGTNKNLAELRNARILRLCRLIRSSPKSSEDLQVQAQLDETEGQLWRLHDLKCLHKSNPTKIKALEKEEWHFQTKHKIAKNLQCCLCNKIAKIPVTTTEGPAGYTLIRWELFRLKHHSEIPDYSQYCHSRYCYELRVMMVEDREQEMAEKERKKQL